MRLAKVAGLTRAEWQEVKPTVLPLLRTVQPRIAESLENIRSFHGRRLPNEDWQMVRSIVLERDGHSCAYCGAKKELEGDHILPLARGGSNDLTNLATACRPCNLSKGSKTLKEWRAFQARRRATGRRQSRRGTGLRRDEGRSSSER